MTRAEFIKDYCDNSNIDIAARRHWGFELTGRKTFAVPCNCSWGDSCKGWGMVSEHGLATHFELYYWPDGEEA